MTAAPAASSLPPRAHPLLRRLRAELEQHYGTRLERLILFGSRARGDAGPESDWDVAVVLRGYRRGLGGAAPAGLDLVRISHDVNAGAGRCGCGTVSGRWAGFAWRVRGRGGRNRLGPALHASGLAYAGLFRRRPGRGVAEPERTPAGTGKQRPWRP